MPKKWRAPLGSIAVAHLCASYIMVVIVYACYGHSPTAGEFALFAVMLLLLSPILGVFAAIALPYAIYSVLAGTIDGLALTFALGYYIPFAFILALMWAFRRASLRERRMAAGLCPTCGYDLRASPERCPECGQPVPAQPIPEECHPALLAASRPNGEMQCGDLSPLFRQALVLSHHNPDLILLAFPRSPLAPPPRPGQTL